MAEYENLPNDEILRQANLEKEIRWRRKDSKERRRKDSKERWTTFAGRIIGEFYLDLYPNVKYDLQIRHRTIGSENWSEWEEASFRATSYDDVRRLRSNRDSSR